MMKLFSIFFSILLLLSCSSTKDLKNEQDLTDPKTKLNEYTIAGCLPVVDNIEIGTETISYSFNTIKDSCFFEGKVYDLETKEPLIGANITLLPCSVCTSTNIDGYYKLAFQSNECDSIEIKYIGYVTDTIIIKDLNN